MERYTEAAPGDRIIGRFIGDLDLLLVRCDAEESDFGAVIVAIDDGSRGEWYAVADSLAAFLREYARYDGQK